MKNKQMAKLSVTILVIVFLLTGCTVDIDPSVANTQFGMQALHYEFIIVLLSIIGGIGCLIAGTVLTILGFTGSIEWIVEASGFTSRLINASPGIVLMIIGFWLTLKSRLKIRAKNHANNH
ncbi:MAG: hypothetical protein NC250_06595 [Alistipes senegalensis]|nr:hypothetical protein [Alistipes senegalensis]